MVSPGWNWRDFDRDFGTIKSVVGVINIIFGRVSFVLILFTFQRIKSSRRVKSKGVGLQDVYWMQMLGAVYKMFVLTIITWKCYQCMAVVALNLLSCYALFETAKYDEI